MNIRISALIGAMLATALLIGSPLYAQSSGAPVTALTGATVHPVSAEPIEDGVVLMQGRDILAVGSGLDIPDNAEVIALDGKHVYPGFVHPLSSLGLTEIGSVAGTVDTTEMGAINAALRAEVAFNHDSALLPTSRYLPLK